jgi:hypothetical protein
MKKIYTMNKLLKCLFVFACLYGGVVTAQNVKNSKPLCMMEQHFRQIPDAQKLAVYWYWMSDNISEEGVVKDLQAMKRAGINRAYIGNIGGQGVPYGKVKFLSEEWWRVLHTALKTATALNIEIGIFNSAGWSQSGGPWVKASQSMRYLTSRQIKISGARKFVGKLPYMGKDAQDVKVVAYPAVEQTCSFVPRQKLSDAYSIDLVSSVPAVVRSLTIQTVHTPHSTDAELFVKENGAYRSVAKFGIDRSNDAINVGFDPYAPVVISIPETRGSEFRLVIGKDNAGMIESVNLSNVPKVERYPEKTLAKMWQTPHPMFFDYMWRSQPDIADKTVVVPVDKVIDITRYMNAEGVLTWNVPKGRWIVMRTAMVPTGQTNEPAAPEATGLETDKMSVAHIRSHFDAYIGEILRRIPEADRKTFKIVVEDSYETGGQNWTDSMIDDFINHFGYNPIPFLPVYQGVVVGSEDQSDRFLWDVRRLIADEVAYNYVGGLKKVSNEHGLTTWLENYGHWGFPAEFLQYGGQSDEIAGEFWSVGDLGNIENRASSSCGHIYGKQKIWAESFTCGGPDFSRYPGEMKARGDRFFTEGINSTLLHLYIQQPDERVPGINAPFGNEFNRHNTWFSQLDVFAKYLKRCNYMLQQGQYIADAAYFIGEDAPKMTGICEPALPKGYSFDYINAEVLMKYAHVENGCLVLKSGMKYRVLVLPVQTTMRPEVLRRIKDMVGEGLTILGPAPTQSPSLQNYPHADAEVKSMAGELWNEGSKSAGSFYTFGKGRVYPSSSTLEKVFADMNVVPDFSTAKADAPLLFIHRKLSDGDCYFVANQSDTVQAFDASFRVKGYVPELWNPQTAELRSLPRYTANARTTTLPMTLQPWESAFVIFRMPAPTTITRAEGENYPAAQVQTTIEGPWTVSFQEKRGGPDKPVVFETLTDWTKNADDRIKYFSGTATYMTTFKMKKLPTAETYIDLGKVMVMAKVKLNGHYVGGVWTAPYRLNITKYLKKGKNLLEVEVVNDWKNRLIRDKSLPANEKITWQTYSYYQPDSPLQKSGLLGPVKIQSFNYEMIENK